MREWIIKRHREHRKQDTELRQSKQKTQHRQSKISNTYGHLQKPRVKLGVCERLEVLFRMWSSRENTKKKQKQKQKQNNSMNHKASYTDSNFLKWMPKYEGVAEKIKLASDINKHVMYHSPGKDNFWLGSYSSPLYFLLFAFVSCL